MAPAHFCRNISFRHLHVFRITLIAGANHSEKSLFEMQLCSANKSYSDLKSLIRFKNINFQTIKHWPVIKSKKIGQNFHSKN